MFSGSFFVARVPKAVRRLITAALVVVALVSVAALQAPVSHAEPHGCGASTIGYTGQVSLSGAGMSGYVEGWLYAYYDTYSGAYCGYMTTQAHAHLNKGSAWGYMEAFMRTCSGGSSVYTPVVNLNGGSTSGWEYWSGMSPQAYINCGNVDVQSWSNGHVLQIYTGNHWA